LEPLKKIEPSSSEVKIENKYNKNFSGLYCTCKRPYPDPEDPIEDEMIQCIICEDWYHGRHLNAKIPDSSNYSEMSCFLCIQKNEFLMDYSGSFAVETIDNSDANDSILNVTTCDESLAIDDNDKDNEPSSAKKIKLADDACIRPKSLPQSTDAPKSIFWKDLRSNLCKCSACLQMYGENEVMFLIDPEDPVHKYEEKGKNKPKTSVYENSLQALQSLPLTNQIDAITSYQRMKEKLFEFLQTFVTNNQIVTEEDIRKFFSSMKKAGNQAPQQTHFCR
jgi:E3 ubiquitin-protein ligase UBR7